MRAGQRLLGLSDPIRNSEVWELNDRPSLGFVADALRMRSGATVDFIVSPDVIGSLQLGGRPGMLSESWPFMQGE
jgi:hypothetical protein